MGDIDKTKIDTSPPGVRMRLGPYETTDLLGRGGMAVVYKGIQQSLGRVVAIKVLPKEFSRDRQFVGRFHREAESVAKLNHPNIIQIIDKGEDAGTCYFVMEYVKGQSLAQRLQSKGIDFKELIQIAMQVCSALHYAHEQGVVHRDIKPANILIDDATGLAKVADFGIAQLAEKSTAIGTLTGDHMAMGTLDYMSPEQKRDAKNVDRRTDVYSIGVMMYEMATGRVPMGIFDPPSKLNRDVSKDFDTIVMRCLRDRPSDRFASCQELTNALTTLPQSPSTMIRVISSVKSAATALGTSIGKRRPLAIGAVAMLLIGLGLGGWAIAKYSKKGGAGEGAGKGPEAGTGAGTGTDVPKEDPDKAFRDRIAAARAGAADGQRASILKALVLLTAMERDAPASCQEELKTTIAELMTKKTAAATTEAREKLAGILRDAPSGGDYGQRDLEKLRSEAMASGADVATMDEIGGRIEEAKEKQVAAGVDQKERDRMERFEKAMERARKHVEGGSWDDAETAAREADPDAKADAEKGRLAVIRTRITSGRAAAQTAEQNRRDFLKAIQRARESMGLEAWGMARDEVARARGFAKSEEETAEADALSKEIVRKETEDAFLELMKDAAAREAATPAQARDKYLEAAKKAPTPEDEKAALDKAAVITKRLDDAKREKDYEVAIKAARLARETGNWNSALEWARKALAAKIGDKDAGDIVREADEALKKVKPPVDPPPVDPLKTYSLKFWKLMPGTFKAVSGVAVEPGGKAYVVEGAYKTLHRYDAAGNETGSVQLTGVVYPDRLACDSKGNLWVLDLKGLAAFRIDPESGNVLQKVGGPGRGVEHFAEPKALAVDGAGDIFVTDGAYFRVSRFTSAGSHKLIWGKKQDRVGDTNGEFVRPEGISIAPDGKVWVTDYALKTVQKFNVDGTHVETFKTNLAGPLDISHRRGKIYILEYDGLRVSVFDEKGVSLAQVGSKGRNPDQFGRPWFLATGPDGKVYVGDTAYDRISVWEEGK